MREQLSSVPGVRTQVVGEDAAPCFYTFPIEVEDGAGLTRNELLTGLAREKVDYRLWSNVPLASYSIFGQEGAVGQQDSFPVAERLCRNSVGLRVDPVLSRREHRDTVHAIRRLLSWGRERASEPRARS